MATGTKRLTRKQAARYLRRFFGRLNGHHGTIIRSQTMMRRCECDEKFPKLCGNFTDVQDGDIESREQIAEFVAGHSNFQLWRN